MGVDGFKGVMRPTTDNDVWELISSRKVTMRGGIEYYTFEANLSECQDWGITSVEVHQLIQTAQDTAREERYT